MRLLLVLLLISRGAAAQTVQLAPYKRVIAVGQDVQGREIRLMDKFPESECPAGMEPVRESLYDEHVGCWEYANERNQGIGTLPLSERATHVQILWNSSGQRATYMKTWLTWTSEAVGRGAQP